LSAQSPDTGIYRGVYSEYNTLILITHNIKLYTDLNYYNLWEAQFNLQPGVEFIYSIPGAERTFFPGSPYYDINLLTSIRFFPDYGISLTPIIGLYHRITSNKYYKDASILSLKYGTTLELNISKDFSIIGKVMNMSEVNEGDIKILLGAGINWRW
jgi:hypothetical protein